MRTSEECGAIYKKVFQIMSDVPEMEKSKWNEYGKFKYIPHDEVTKAVRALLLKHQVLSVVTVTRNSRESSSLTTVDITIRLVDIETNQFIEIDGSGTCSMDNDKAYGAALSYAIKYAYLKLFHIESGEPDTDDNKDDKVYNPSDMSEYLQDYFLEKQYQPERIKQIWLDNEKDWAVVEERLRKHQEDNKTKGRKK